jgi:hypothetical protein
MFSNIWIFLKHPFKAGVNSVTSLKGIHKGFLILLTIPFFIALTGCASVKLVNAPGRKANADAPVNESSRAGMVKYSIEGSGEDVEERRQEAYELMTESCRGSYKVLSEDIRKEGKLIRTGSSRGIGESEDQEMYIKFECV